MWERLGLTRTDPKRAADPGPRLAALLSDDLADRDRVTVVVVGEHPQTLAVSLRQARPSWHVVDLDGDADTLHVALAVLAPVDALIDDGPVEGRVRRFRHLLYHVRPGGRYVVPGAASELGRSPGELGGYLADAAALPVTSLRKGARRSIAENSLLAVRKHVTALAAGSDLVVSHNLADVRVKLDEPQTNAYLQTSDGPRGVLETRPTGPRPRLKRYAEGPVRRDPRVDGRIEKTKLFLREYRDVLVGIEQLVMTDRVMLADSFRHHRRRYLTSRSVVDVAPRFGIPKRRPPRTPKRLPGTYLHLDNEVRGHFGHLLTESLSRAWSWKAALAIDPDVRVLLGATKRRPEIAGWEYLF